MIETDMPENNSKKIRLLIIHPALAPYRLHLFNALGDRCHLRLLFLLRNLLDQKFDQSVLVSQLKPEHGYLTRGIILLKRTFRFGIGAEIARFQPDVVVTTEFSPATISVAIHRLYGKKSYKHIVWTDDDPESIHSDTIARRLLRRLLLPRLDGLVCIAEETASLYRSRFDATMPMGIVPILHEESIFREAVIRATPVARELVEVYRLEGKRILLFVGRLATEKRIDRLLQAFSQIHDLFADVCMVLVGDGPQREWLQELAKELGVEDRVIFTGRVEGAPLYAWYRLGGLFVLPSDLERFGAVVNEALLAGIPVVCSNKAGARVLIQDGANGTVVDVSEPAKLKSAINEWLVRTPPFTIEHLAQLPPSLMITPFQNSVDGFLSVLREVSLQKSGSV
jgi:glycosyltransferase involved in cell wall biosynthesis